MTVSFHKGRYGVRLAETAADLAACQALRHQCFFASAGLDTDAYDPVCEHIMIAGPQGLVATCRVMRLGAGAEIGRSYAAERYDLQRLSHYPDPMMEVGRFCVAPNVGQADVLRLIWGTLAQIVDASGIRLLFGCSSFAGTDPAPYGRAFAHLASRAAAPARWQPGQRAVETVPLVAHGEGTAQMPPLLRSYLSLGGWVSDHAVIDRELGTLHVFTGLEIAAIPPRRAAALRAIAATQ